MKRVALAVKGALRASVGRLAAAEAVLLRPERFGGEWLPDKKAVDLLLSCCPGLRYLELPAECSAGVERLVSLEHLVLTGTSGPRRLDLAPFQRMRALTLTWSKGVTGWSDLRRLRCLALHYCKDDSLGFLGRSATTLKSLSLKASSVRDFSVLDSARRMEWFAISGSGKLSMNAAIFARWRSLIGLNVAGYSLAGLDSVGLPAGVDWILLKDVGDLANLKFLRRAHPRCVAISGKKTRVLDGDLAMLTQLTGSMVSVDPMRKEYNVAKRDLPTADLEPPTDVSWDPTGFRREFDG